MNRKGGVPKTMKKRADRIVEPVGRKAVPVPAPAPIVKEEQPLPRASYKPAIFFALLSLFRIVLQPIYTGLKTTGIIGRPDYTHYGNCTITPGPKFCEHEILVDGVVYLSCDANRLNWNTVMGPLNNPDPKGSIWKYDIDKDEAVELTVSIDGDFHPLGMTYYDDKIYIINHQRTGPTIEIFTKEMRHIRTIPAHPEIRSANGIIAGPTGLYVTNDHTWPRLAHGYWATIEAVLNLVYPQTFITHIDHNNDVMTRAYSSFPFANGIASSDDGKIYVASSSSGSVTLFEPRNASTPLLRKIETLRFGYCLDNVHVVNGDVFVGGHPSFWSLIKLSRGHDVTSPSWISMARRGEQQVREGRQPIVNKEWDMRTLYHDDGTHFQTATGGVYDEKRNVLVAGGLYQDGVLVCRDVL